MADANADSPGEPPNAQHQKDPSLFTSLRPVFAGRARQLSALSFSAICGAMAEAIVLVAITQVAFALSKSNRTVVMKLGPITFSGTIGPFLLVCCGLVLVRLGFQVLAGWQSAALVADVMAVARRQLSSAYLHASWSAQALDTGGRLQELLTTFVSNLAKVVDTASKGVMSIFSLIALLAMAVAVSPFASLGLLVAVAILAVTLQPLRRVMRSTSRGVADTNLTFATSVAEVSGIGREIHTFGVVDEVDRRVGNLIDINAKATRRQGFLAFLFTPLYVTTLLLLLVGALFAIHLSGTKDLAALGAVMMVMLRSLAYGQLTQAVYGSLHTSVPYVEDLGAQLAVYQAAAERVDGTVPERVGELRCENVGFSYDGEAAALQNVTCTINPGELIGIVGPSGSGKTTFVHLLLRLYRPTSGELSAGGVPFDQIALDFWHQRVGFVPQEPRLIAGTVADNVSFYRDDVTREAIERACRMAQLHDEIVAMPAGYDSVIGSGIGQLSGGQRQRLIIARALAANPEVLVLDEPTSALDVKSEAGVRDVLVGLRGSVTVVVIAHRLSTVESCDRLMVLQDGRLVAEGPPKDLAESSEFYREAVELSRLS